MEQILAYRVVSTMGRFLEYKMPILLWVVFPLAILSACFSPAIGAGEEKKPASERG